MDPVQKRELKRQAWLRLAAQKRRAGLLRGRVVALSLICFIVLWGVVFAQMATGNDPVLSAKEKTVASTGAAKGSRRKPQATNPRELESGRATDALPNEEQGAAEPSEVEAEPEFEEFAEAEPEFEEFAEAEPEFEEFEEAEPEFEEPVAEPEFEEPLVTSQS